MVKEFKKVLEEFYIIWNYVIKLNKKNAMVIQKFCNILVCKVKFLNSFFKRFL